MAAARPVWPLVVGCLLLSAVTLLLPTTVTYDPMSWVVWGREIARGELVTSGGPSWKPLPIVFTVPFSLFGDAAPQLWAWIARAGAFAAMAMGYRLGTRMAGRRAGLIAAVAILASEGYAYGAWRGNSEGIMVALTLLAVERHLDDRPVGAFVLAGLAALVRPEIWPLWGVYGLWLLWKRRDLVTAGLVLGGGAFVLAAWFVPEYLGSGDFLRAANRARDPNLDSAAFSRFPALLVIGRTIVDCPVVVLVPAVIAVVVARRRRVGAHDHVVLVLAGATAALMLAVAAMTQFGFSGNQRYVVLPLAFVAVLAGAGWVELAGWARRRSPRAVTAVTIVALAGVGLQVALDAGLWGSQWRRAGREAESNGMLASTLRDAGGAGRLNACEMVYATRFEVPVVAWELQRHLRDTQIFAIAPGAAIGLRGSALSRDPRFAPVAESKRWIIRTADC